METRQLKKEIFS